MNFSYCKASIDMLTSSKTLLNIPSLPTKPLRVSLTAEVKSSLMMCLDSL